ncbi:uroporphyrinogen-III C-methyltransferase [Chitinophaga pinensis]|uniref:uroporphyrinogen-III C-methyltransferase n=1 Tax=Chitinophaga pinensis (strain ATCC 43595 / DSM 2588 / LMG 13176 / NBRC 15968 / NCIMB 11800 / UQM 2034) TaxID=485918 RepID=A0A979GAW2_CHIPD|nr:uroporphyrinogen-III C-methyltransferase [Chitinophaga pinensis]ACU64020.1 uroporphyrin-III C-methyltransferase [Chitinophaga pinensis DSM 2588]
MQTIHPKLTLVGAGPGDPELITVKGLKAIQQARVILYDALSNNELLEHASCNCLKRFVGKRAGMHMYTQEEINRMIVKYALTYGSVVRLKGGDSFVFGRGQEELAFAQQFNIDTEVIPGVTSAISVPGINKIPVTARNVSEGFWVLTGTTQRGSLSRDLAYAVQADTTVVVLMGMGKLDEISAAYVAQGKGNVPAAIIQNGTMPDQKIGIGNVADLQEIALRDNLRNPAIIVVGEVVRFHEAFQTVQEKIAEQLKIAV